MSSDPKFIQYVADQIAEDCEITHRAMFGGHTFYSKGKVVLLVCDDRVYVKPTDAGREYIGEVVEAPAYEGAKPSFLIEDGLDDSDWFSELIRVTERALPKPRKKKR